MTTIREREAIPRFGEIVNTAEQLALCPSETVLDRADGRATIQKGADGRWYPSGRSWMPEEQALQIITEDQPYMVKFINAEVDETPKQFAHRFRAVVLHGEQEHFGQEDYSRRALDELADENADFGFTPSVGQRLISRGEQRDLPNGTRVYVGTPDSPGTFGLWEKNEYGNWDCLFGDGGHDPDGYPVTIDALPDGKTEPDEWLTAKPTDEDRAKVREMRRRAWERGMDERDKHGWCGSYQNVVSRAGLTERVMETLLPGGFKAGDIVTPEQAHSLPVGTLLWAANREKQTYSVYERLATARNKAGTKQVGGNTTGHFANEMVIGSRVNRSQWSEGRAHDMLPLWSVQVLRCLPVGSEIALPRSRSDVFRKIDTETWDYIDRAGRPAGNNYNNEAFRHGADGSTEYWVSSFGEGKKA